MSLGVTPDADTVPDDIDALRAALLAERTARHEAEARATGAEALIAHLKLLIAKLQRDRFGPTSERSRRLLDQFELQLEELEADAAEAEAKRPEPAAETRSEAARAKPVRGPLPAHLPRERVVIPGPTECPCCRGKLAKLGETITETLEVIPRQWKVIQTVREKFTCLYSLIVTAKLNDVDPRAWLAHVLRTIADQPASQLDELLPWNWRKTDITAAAA